MFTNKKPNRHYLIRSLGALALAALLVLSGCDLFHDDEPAVNRTISDVHVHASQDDSKPVIENAQATLTASDQGVSFSLQTYDLDPGHVATVWVILINDPEACDARPCTAPEILSETEALKANVTYGDGVIVEGDGSAAFTGWHAAGDMPEGWFENDFTNPREAEIHLVVNDHGPALVDDAALLASQLGSYRGGCTDESLPPPFPATAKADGIPGPNTCRLVQDAIFQQ